MWSIFTADFAQHLTRQLVQLVHQVQRGAHPVAHVGATCSSVEHLHASGWCAGECCNQAQCTSCGQAAKIMVM